MATIEKDHGSEAGSSATAMKERERPLNELLSRDMVDLYVGSENTHWILHEKLLCHRSRFFRNIFYGPPKAHSTNRSRPTSKTHTYGLPDIDDAPFQMFVGWLYSDALPQPADEKALGPLFELYLMGEKWEIRKLVLDVLDAVRRWYHESNSWPSLRRVQYIYANSATEAPMRQLLVSCVARMLVTGDGIPKHWENALRRNGELAVDVILCVQKWKVDESVVPDARDESVVPFVEEAEEKREENGMGNGKVKEEETEDDAKEGGAVDGEAKEEDGPAKTNGVNGH